VLREQPRPASAPAHSGWRLALCLALISARARQPAECRGYNNRRRPGCVAASFLSARFGLKLPGSRRWETSVGSWLCGQVYQLSLRGCGLPPPCVSTEQHRPDIRAFETLTGLQAFPRHPKLTNWRIRLRIGGGLMRNKLLSSVAGAAFSLAASGLAFAADVAVKAPPPAPAPVYNWTGWYVGVNAGASMGKVKTDFNAPGSFAATVGVNSVPLAATFAGSGFDEVYPGGFIGGGQIGFNWQLSPLWVVGAEADFQGADEKEHSTPSFGVSGPAFFGGLPFGTANGTAAFDYTAKIEWFGTARLRAGYLFGDGAVLTYVTGGLAYGKVDVAGTSALSVPFVGSFLFEGVVATQAFDHSNVNTGWVVGSGTEGKLLIPGWTYKIEGLYMDLGHLDVTGPGGSVGSLATNGFTLTAGPVHTHTHFTDTILRVGLNYQFH
jgi:outer membrane immunogenic protein